MILDLESSYGLTQLKFRSEEGCRSPLIPETLLPLAELLLLPGGLFSVLVAFQLGRGPALPVRDSLVPELGERVGALWSTTSLDPDLVPPAVLVPSFLRPCPILGSLGRKP